MIYSDVLVSSFQILNYLYAEVKKVPVIGDSYMGMFLPSDISERVENFIARRANFPIIDKEEIMGVFYLFGKNYGIRGQTEILSATDLARRTIEQLAKNVRYFHNMPNKLDSNSVREDYIKRVLQISIDLQQNHLGQKPELSARIVRDPTILTICFAQHIAYYQRDYFFEFFQPFKKSDLPTTLSAILEGRMLLLGFNVKNRKALPYENSLTPFIRWLDKII